MILHLPQTVYTLVASDENSPEPSIVVEKRFDKRHLYLFARRDHAAAFARISGPSFGFVPRVAEVDLSEIVFQARDMLGVVIHSAHYRGEAGKLSEFSISPHPTSRHGILEHWQ